MNKDLKKQHNKTHSNINETLKHINTKKKKTLFFIQHQKKQI